VTGPLAGVRVVEFIGQGPGPFACMLLADLGAELIGVERVGAHRHPSDAHVRGRRAISIDLKDARGREVVLDLLATADACVEGFRPGVMERLGLGPTESLARNPRLVYGRVTGWGQQGPLAQAAGHDINYLAISGGLAAIGEPGGAPVPPLNLAADYGGGGLLLALGIVAALHERATSGRGQVVDAAMVDGLGLMLAPFHALAARGAWGERGTNLLDGGAPFYRTYATSDGRHLAVGAIEPQFYAEFLRVLGLDQSELGPQMDRACWPAAAESITRVIATRSREEWTALFDGVDACVSPVLDFAEATQHPHAIARGQFADVGGVPHPVPGPRFDRSLLTPPADREPPGHSTSALLASLGLKAEQMGKLRDAGVVA